jgi:hypothetical protein
MKFSKVCNFGQVSTSGFIRKYKKVFWNDKSLKHYLVTFDNGYALDIDSDDITEKELVSMIKRKRIIHITYSMDYYDIEGEVEK